MNETTAAIRDIQAVAQDLYTLAQLQTELCKKEFQDKQRFFVLPSMMLAMGSILTLSSIPIGLVAMAIYLVELADLSHGMAFLVSTVVGLSLGGLLVASGAVLMGRRIRSIESLGELRRTLHWMMAIIRKRRFKTSLHA
jgi:hypothetical protein